MQPCTLYNKRTNWHLFRELVEIILTTQISLKDESDIIYVVEHFNINVQHTAWNSTPSDNTKVQHDTSNNKR